MVKEFEERVQRLFADETKIFFDFSQKHLQNWIRCNTLKISPEELLSILKEKWRVEQPFQDFPEIIKVEKLAPGELGKAEEHKNGFYYIQDIASMMPVIALAPEKNENLLDLCAAPGGKTTQAAALMQNSGLIVANDVHAERIKILMINLQKCGVMNAILTKEEGARLCEKLQKIMLFDKILLDPTCSEEGAIRQNEEVLKKWNLNRIKEFSAQQKRLASSAISCLRQGGIMLYSTCTLAPEENEEVIDFLLNKFDIAVEKINLPIKTRNGIEEWQGKHYNSEVKKCIRIYPQDNDSLGFFIARVRKK